MDSDSLCLYVSIVLYIQINEFISCYIMALDENHLKKKKVLLYIVKMKEIGLPCISQHKNQLDNVYTSVCINEQDFTQCTSQNYCLIQLRRKIRVVNLHLKDTRFISTKL